MASEQKINRAEPEFLNSWKEISNYMGRGVRTAQRYEEKYGLPVRRPAGKSRSSVMATRTEIDAWVAAAPIRETQQISPPPLKEQAPEVLSIQDGVAEMRKLRQQMLELRAETNLALSALMSSLCALRYEMQAARHFAPPWGGGEFPLEQQRDRKN